MPRIKQPSSPPQRQQRPVVVDVAYEGQAYGPPKPEKKIGDVADPPPPPIPEIQCRSEESIANYVDFCYRQIQLERERREETTPLFMMSVAKYTFFTSFVVMTLYFCYNGPPGILGYGSIYGEEIILGPCWTCNAFGFILQFSCTLLDGVATVLYTIADVLHFTKIMLMQKYSDNIENRNPCTACMFQPHQTPYQADYNEEISDELDVNLQNLKNPLPALTTTETPQEGEIKIEKKMCNTKKCRKQRQRKIQTEYARIDELCLTCSDKKSNCIGKHCPYLFDDL